MRIQRPRRQRKAQIEFTYETNPVELLRRLQETHAHASERDQSMEHQDTFDVSVNEAYHSNMDARGSCDIIGADTLNHESEYSLRKAQLEKEIQALNQKSHSQSTMNKVSKSQMNQTKIKGVFNPIYLKNNRVSKAQSIKNTPETKNFIEKMNNQPAKTTLKPPETLKVEQENFIRLLKDEIKTKNDNSIFVLKNLLENNQNLAKNYEFYQEHQDLFTQLGNYYASQRMSLNERFTSDFEKNYNNFVPIPLKPNNPIQEPSPINTNDSPKTTLKQEYDKLLNNPYLPKRTKSLIQHDMKENNWYELERHFVWYQQKALKYEKLIKEEQAKKDKFNQDYAHLVYGKLTLKDLGKELEKINKDQTKFNKEYSQLKKEDPTNRGQRKATLNNRLDTLAKQESAVLWMIEQKKRQKQESNQRRGEKIRDSARNTMEHNKELVNYYLSSQGKNSFPKKTTTNYLQLASLLRMLEKMSSDWKSDGIMDEFDLKSSYDSNIAKIQSFYGKKKSSLNKENDTQFKKEDYLTEKEIKDIINSERESENQFILNKLSNQFKKWGKKNLDSAIKDSHTLDQPLMDPEHVDKNWLTNPIETGDVMGVDDGSNPLTPKDLKLDKTDADFVIQKYNLDETEFQTILDKGLPTEKEYLKKHYDERIQFYDADSQKEHTELALQEYQKLKTGYEEITA